MKMLIKSVLFLFERYPRYLVQQFLAVSNKQAISTGHYRQGPVSIIITLVTILHPDNDSAHMLWAQPESGEKCDRDAFISQTLTGIISKWRCVRKHSKMMKIEHLAAGFSMLSKRN